MMKFNAKLDVSREMLTARAKAETDKIYSNPSTSRGRTWLNIFETSCYGLAAEVYLIEHQGFSDDPRPYKDVLDPDGTPVEVKVTQGDYYVPYVIARCNQAANESFRDYPKKLMVFIANKTSYNYELYGTYKFNEKTKVFTKIEDL